MNSVTLELKRQRGIPPFEGYDCEMGMQAIKNFFQIEKVAQMFACDWRELHHTHVSFQKAIFSVIVEKNEVELYTTSITVVNPSPNIRRCKFQCTNVEFQSE